MHPQKRALENSSSALVIKKVVHNLVALEVGALQLY